MSLARARLAPGAARRTERLGPVAVVAIALAIAGAVLTIWRPLAPAVGQVSTDLDVFTAGTLEVIAEYRRPRYLAGLAFLAIELAVPLLFVVTRRGRAAISRWGGPRDHAPLRGGAVAGLLTLIGSLVALPLRIAMGFVHEGRWGFRAAGPALWGRDVAVNALLAAAGVAVVVAVLLWAIHRWPRTWHLRMVLLGTGIAAVVVLAYPLAIEPLFSQTRPLEDGPVRDEVAAVLESAGVGDLPIQVSDASTRTTRVNAYVSGLGPTRNVVLYDNLLSLPPDQVGVVVAHELAHRQHLDIARGTLLTATALLFGMLALRVVLTSPATANAVGARSASDPRLVALILVLAVVANTAGLPLASAISRRAEAAADARALELTDASDELIRTARLFAVRDLSQPSPPGWVAFLWATHPTVDQRIRAAAAHAEREGLPLPTLAEVRAAEAEVRHPALPDVSAGE